MKCSLGFRTFVLQTLFALCAGGCETSAPPAFDFYGERIAPVMTVGCVQQTAGCHLASDKQTAVGNLDLSSYDALMRRKDVLAATGPYPVGALLLKGGDAADIAVQTFDAPDPAHPDERFVAITTDIRHGGGRLLRVGSDGYATLKSWIAQGHRRDGVIDEPLSKNLGACRKGAGSHPGFDPAQAPADKKSFDAFVRDVEPVLVERCAGSSCHGSKIADLYLSCGSTEAEKRWNYFVTLAHVDPSGSRSELLRRPLSKMRGGTFHEGGTIFANTDDAGYKTLRAWVDDVAERLAEDLRYDPEHEGLRFFGNYVQPMLVKKGCMFGNCHAPSMFHDLRLRTGSQGSFSRIAIDRNYEAAKLLLALESDDPNDSRLIAKNLFSHQQDKGHGIPHRGGSLLEDFPTPATAAQCAEVDVLTTPLDEVPAYCALVQWHALERALSVAEGKLNAGPNYGLVYVSRPVDVGDPRDFDTYRPGADLLFAGVSLDENGKPSLGESRSLLTGCGLDRATADVRGPAVSWNAKKLAFAARSTESAPLRLYEANADGTNCAPIAGVAASKESVNGILTHDFDPSYAPDGRLVFASTRGNIQGKGFSYQGPQRTPSQLAPNANLYIAKRSGEEVELRQLTFLSNQELMPSFMLDGRLIFTAEKRAPEFFQLAGRRINLDGGDYHPLVAQRDSIGFARATEIIELPNRNFAMVAGSADAKDGAGSIAILNRSLGPDQSDRPANDAYYMASVRVPKKGAGEGSTGVYRSPTSLPSRWLVVSCELAATALTQGRFDFDLCAFDPVTGSTQRIAGESGRAEIEAVAIYSRVPHGVFRSRPDEANGNTSVDSKATDAEVHVADFPVLATLLFANTRTGRPIDSRIKGIDVLESLPPPTSALSFDKLDPKRVTRDAFGQVYTHYESLGPFQLEADGSTKFRFEGGHPIVLRPTDGQGRSLSFPEASGPFTGDMIQREEMQFYPGERANQSFRRELFDGMCAGCHGSLSGHELDVAVDIDVLTHASRTDAKARPAIDLR